MKPERRKKRLLKDLSKILNLAKKLDRGDIVKLVSWDNLEVVGCYTGEVQVVLTIDDKSSEVWRYESTWSDEIRFHESKNKEMRIVLHSGQEISKKYIAKALLTSLREDIMESIRGVGMIDGLEIGYDNLDNIERRLRYYKKAATFFSRSKTYK